MTHRILLVALVALGVLGGCTPKRAMQPRMARLEGEAPTQTECVGEVCFVYADQD
jgi:hypothetical protein